MDKLKAIELLKTAVEQALEQYDTENVDIMADEESGMLDIIYHSRHNSFPIICDVCPADCLSELEIAKIADSYDIGYCF